MEPVAGTSETRENAQPLTGELFSRYKALAKETGMWLSLGGFHETCEEEEGKIYNTHAVLDANGELVAAYRCHGFRVCVLHSLRVSVRRLHLSARSSRNSTLDPRPWNPLQAAAHLRSTPEPSTLNTQP